jgi:hypothetical protein
MDWNKAHFDQRRERRPDLFMACMDHVDPAVFDTEYQPQRSGHTRRRIGK